MMIRDKMPKVAVALAALALCFAGQSASAAAVDTTLFNADDNNVADTGGPDDAAGLGTNFAASSSIPGDDPKDAFGNNDLAIEPDSFIFANGRTADSGDATIGNGGESVDSLTWETTSVVVIDGYRLFANADGASPDRGTQLVEFSTEGEVDHFADRNGASGAIDYTLDIPQVGDNFQLRITHTNDKGARINEIDAITTDTSAAVVNTTIFNATTNTGGDQAAGLATNFTHSALVNGSETVEDAFGNNDGGVEPTSLLFVDGGVVDNRNNIFGDGGETVSFVQWETTMNVRLDGYRATFEGDGGVEDAPRSTELVRFLVDGVQVDLFDLNGHTGTFDRLFAGGTVTGKTFRLELTRATSGAGNSGPRIQEIDALNAVAVPAPAALPAGLALIVTLAAGRRRRN